MRDNWAAELQQTAHAYLFLGPGPELRQAAKDFAMALNCESPREGKACGVCESCRRISKGGFADLEVLTPAGAYYKIEQIRALQRKVNQSRSAGKVQVFILEAADAMQDAAANCLLKTLEEPGPERVLLLLAENADRILPTVASRCRILSWQDPTEPPDAAVLQPVWSWLERLPAAAYDEIFAFSENLAKEREEIPLFLDRVETILADNYIGRSSGGNVRVFPLPGWPQEKLFRAWEEVQKARKYFSYPVNGRLLLDTLLLTMKGA